MFALVQGKNRYSCSRRNNYTSNGGSPDQETPPRYYLSFVRFLFMSHETEILLAPCTRHDSGDARKGHVVQQNRVSKRASGERDEGELHLYMPESQRRALACLASNMLRQPSGLNPELASGFPACRDGAGLRLGLLK